MGDVVDIGDLVIKTGSKIKDASGPDDGKPKSCWLKSHGRGFGSIPSGLFSKDKSCNPGREMQGGLCYDVCKAGKGVGPVCWGTCPTGTKACGVLCQLEGETCAGMLKNITKTAIETGVKGAGQDYFGAIKGAIGIADQLTYPVCAVMNDIEAELWAMMEEDEFDFDHQMYDQYFLM